MVKLSGVGVGGINIGIVSTADPYYSNVAVLMHFEDNLADVKGNAITSVGSITYPSGKFGKGVSIPAGGSIVMPPSSGVQRNILTTTSPATVEMWVYLTSTSWASGGAALGYGEMDKVGDTNYWSFGVIPGNKISLFWWSGQPNSLNGTTTIPTNTWTHIAMSVSGSVAKLFINGVQDASGSFTTPPASASVGLGGYYSAAFPGYIDEFRITKGVARYTSNFTAPTTLFPESS